MTPGLAGILYGTEGIGKTSLSLQFPKPLLCISIKESGYRDLSFIGAVPKHCTGVTISTWKELLKHTNFPEGTVVIDSLSGLQKILFDYVCETQFSGNWENFTGYFQGQRTYSPVVLDQYLDLVDQKVGAGVNIIFLGHAVTEDTVNTFGANYLTHVISMDNGSKGGIRSNMTKWASFIFFLALGINITRSTEIDNKTKQVLEGKAKDDDNRLIYTTKSPGHSAKNRWNLPPVIPMGNSPEEAFNNLWKTFPKEYQALHTPKDFK